MAYHIYFFYLKNERLYSSKNIQINSTWNKQVMKRLTLINKYKNLIKLWLKCIIYNLLSYKVIEIIKIKMYLYKIIIIYNMYYLMTVLNYL